MIQIRGKYTTGQGTTIDQMIKLLEQEYPVKEPVQLWFKDDENINMVEYGVYIPGEQATIIVATRNRTPNQIAGIIAQQYARHLQAIAGEPDNIGKAAEFAKEMNKKNMI